MTAAAPAEHTPFGCTRNGKPVEIFTLRSRSPVVARILTYGATLQSLLLPDADGVLADCVLGYAEIEGYQDNIGYFGATIGRVANRIANGRFVLDGVAYQLARNNNGVAALHGGMRGFDKQPWDVVAADSASVTLRLVSPDGDEGYPGTVTATARYGLDDAGTLTLEYCATSDRPTVINMTNHSLFAIGGEGNATGTGTNRLTIVADAYLPVDAALIPTGEVRSVEGTAFDFRRPTSIAANIRDARDGQIRQMRGYDHCFVIAGGHAAAPRLVARLEHPASGRAMEVHSDQPGLQFYAGNNLNGSIVGKSGRAYRQGDGLALEPQGFPDAPNQPRFGSIRLDPGETYRNTILLRPCSIRPIVPSAGAHA